MGIFDIFKRKGVDDETFHATQFQTEILAFAFWKYNEKGNDYNKVKIELYNLKDVNLSEKQIEIIIEKLKTINDNKDAKSIQIGQIWEYKTRINEEKSRVKIFKIDNVNNEEIIHIIISDLKIKNTQKTENVDNVGHVPLSKKAFLSSITKLERQESILPQIEEGYYEWNQAYSDGKAGVFDIEIKEVVNYIEQTLNQ
jgi:hypothetical protein